MDERNKKWNIVANIFRHLDAEEPSTLYYGAASNRVTSRLTGGWGKALTSIVLLQCDATFMRKTSFCQIDNHIYENMLPKLQVCFHYATFTLQDNFRDLTSETIYLIISRICHTQLSSFNESSKTKTNMQLVHSHIVKYAFSLQQRECLRIFVPKIATYFSTNKFTCYFFVKWHDFSDNGQKAGRHGKDDEERTEGRVAKERPREVFPRILIGYLLAAEGNATRGRR